LVPWGLGVGRVFKTGSTLTNASFELQPSVYRRGVGEPSLQIFFAFDILWK
jgi:hypothetical protein